MKKMASVNMEQYNEDEVGVSVWACPIYDGRMVVWCGPCLHLRVGVPSCAGGEWNWLCRGEGGGGHSSAHSTDSTCALNRWCMCDKVLHVCTCTHARAHIGRYTYNNMYALTTKMAF